LYTIVLSLITLFNVPTTRAFADERFATQVKLTQPVPDFGTAVDIDGNTAAVAATGSRFSPFPDGAVCIYAREATNWSLEQCVTDTDASPNDSDGYGSSIALSGNTLVVGAMGDMTNGLASGAAYVYVRDGHTWTLQQKLFPTDPAVVAWFGVAVDIVGDTIVVGAYGDDDSGGYTGAAYVFRRTGTAWTQEQKLKAADEQADSAFGMSVALSGQTIAIGAPSQSSPDALFSGAVYVFVNNGVAWQQQAKIKASSPMENQNLGFTVSISGDTIVAAAPGEIVGAPSVEAQNVRSKGAVYVFDRSGTSWDHQKRIRDRDINRTGGFGTRAAIDGDTLIIGDPTYDAGARFTGAVYVLERTGNGWSLKYTLTAADAQFLQVMGFAIAISGDTVIAGTSSQFTPPSVYIFQ
jgi:hypothetical protein